MKRCRHTPTVADWCRHRNIIIIQALCRQLHNPEAANEFLWRCGGFDEPVQIGLLGQRHVQG
jgi:hypothetical protein